MTLTVEDLINEIRYAERLCLRTARLYRRLQSATTFLTVAGGSAAITALAPAVPKWVSLTGLVVLAFFSAANVVIRPSDKAAANEADAKRYAQLRTQANGMDAATLKAALDRAREGDAAEIEPLRDVAWNDVVVEIGHPDKTVALKPYQRLLAALA